MAAAWSEVGRSNLTWIDGSYDAIYVSHMGDIMRTTVYLNTADYRRLKVLAEAEGRSAADLVREAVAEYAARRTAPERPRSLASFRSGRGDLSERTDELLEGFGQA